MLCLSHWSRVAAVCRKPGREGVSEETLQQGWLVCCSHRGTHTPRLKHRPWPHCHSFTVTLTNRVASFLSRGLQMWVKGGDVLQKNKRIPHESQLSDMEAHLCQNIHLFFLMRILWVHFILNIEVKWDRWTTAVKGLHWCVLWCLIGSPVCDEDTMRAGVLIIFTWALWSHAQLHNYSINAVTNCPTGSEHTGRPWSDFESCYIFITISSDNVDQRNQNRYSKFEARFIRVLTVNML